MGRVISHAKLLEKSKRIFSDWLIAAEEFTKGGSYVDFVAATAKVSKGFRSCYDPNLLSDHRFGIFGLSNMRDDLDRHIEPLKVGLGVATAAVRLLSTQSSDDEMKAQVEKILFGSMGSVGHRAIRTRDEYRQLEDKKAFVRGSFDSEAWVAAQRITYYIQYRFSDLNLLDEKAVMSLHGRIGQSLGTRRRAILKTLAQ